MNDSNSTDSESDKAKGYHSIYVHHSNQLRTWFVAYGIGGPVLIVTNSQLWNALAPTNSGKLAITGFLVAVALQVLLTMTNKTLMWAVYFGEIQPKVKTLWWYKMSDKLSEYFWIDFFVDVASIIFMSVATVLVLFGVVDSVGQQNILW